MGVMLVDAGGEVAREFDGRKALVRYLDRFFDRRHDLKERDFPIDLLAITHPHKDHTNTVPRILEDYPPRTITHLSFESISEARPFCFLEISRRPLLMRKEGAARRLSSDSWRLTRTLRYTSSSTAQ